MAVINSTRTARTPSPSSALVGLLEMAELEKISCSFMGKSCVHPLSLIGKRIRNSQILSTFGLDGISALESSITVSTVLAVNLGSIFHGIETSLLLQDDDGSNPYYADIADLTVLEVL
jgi:hypothetical protein